MGVSISTTCVQCTTNESKTVQQFQLLVLNLAIPAIPNRTMPYVLRVVIIIRQSVTPTLGENMPTTVML